VRISHRSTHPSRGLRFTYFPIPCAYFFVIHSEPFLFPVILACKLQQLLLRHCRLCLVFSFCFQFLTFRQRTFCCYHTSLWDYPSSQEPARASVRQGRVRRPLHLHHAPVRVDTFRAFGLEDKKFVRALYMEVFKEAHERRGGELTGAASNRVLTEGVRRLPKAVVKQLSEVYCQQGRIKCTCPLQPVHP